MRIAIVGEGNLAMGLMGPLLASRHEVVALVQNGRAAQGVHRALKRTAGYVAGPLAGITGLAMRRGIPVVWIDRMTEAELAPLRAQSPDVLLVGGFSVILKKPILELPTLGCINVHSSLLPKHRGPNPFSAVILTGDEESGVTFHHVDEGIDTGPILEQFRFPVYPQDMALDVYHRACGLGAMHVVEVMDRVEREGMYGRPQQGDGTYDPKLRVEDSHIDWNQSARDIDRRVRALQPFYVGRFTWRGHTVTLTRVRYEDTSSDAPPGTILSNRLPVRIATGNGVVTILAAYASTPVPWIWPAPWNRLRLGERLP